MTSNRTHQPLRNTQDRGRLLDVPTLADQLNVTERFIRRLIAEDRIPFLKIGKFIRFEPDAINLWLDSCRR